MKKQKEIIGLCASILKIAKERGLSATRLCREFPALGCSRTFLDLSKGRLDGYDVVVLHGRYAAVLAGLGG